MFSLRLADDLELMLLEERHVSELAALVAENRERLARFLPWATATFEPEVRTFIRGALEKYARGGGFDAGIVADGELAGVMGVHNVDRAVGRAEIGYWIGARHQGRGLVTRAAAGLTRVLFERWAMNRVEIRCEPENVRSRAVALRLGFVHEGTLRAVHPTAEGGPADLEVFGLLRPEFEQLRQRQEWTA